jgi:hypothetical protein
MGFEWPSCSGAAAGMPIVRTRWVIPSSPAMGLAEAQRKKCHFKKNAFFGDDYLKNRLRDWFKK